MSEEPSAWCDVVKACLVPSADRRGVHVEEVEDGAVGWLSSAAVGGLLGDNRDAEDGETGIELLGACGSG